MVKKVKAQGKTDDKRLAEAIRASAQQIWQAGLGAFAKAQAEGGKAFDKLVKEGGELEQRTQELASGKLWEVTGTMSRMAESAGKRASGSWDKLEQVFEDRVARSLKNLGVPTQQDLDTLARRIEDLHRAVSAIAGKKTAAPESSAKSAATKAAAKTPAKTAAKKAAVKKAAAKKAPARKAAAR